jgi:hypothetical protein
MWIETIQATFSIYMSIDVYFQYISYFSYIVYEKNSWITKSLLTTVKNIVSYLIIFCLHLILEKQLYFQ